MHIRLTLLCALTVTGEAAELREPRPLAFAAQPAGECGGGRAVPLLLRDAVRPDVGPYAVRLAGYSHPAQPDLYAPFLLRMDPGSTTRIALRNLLPDGSAEIAEVDADAAAQARNSVNLHTHGLFTAARAAAPCDLGDYSLFNLGGAIAGRPAPRADYRIAIPATLPGAAVGDARTRAPYPPGLAWFHAHVHGTARDQVTAGMAGMITVGDPRAILPPGMRAGTDIRHLALRDIQLTIPNCPLSGRLEDDTICAPGPARLPDMARSATPARFGTGDGEDATRWDPNLCGTFAGATPGVAPAGITLGAGFCAPPATEMGRAIWLFTVNGQWMPEITLRPGRATLLRLANLSASVSYVLRLEGESLRVLAADGVVAGSPAPTGPGVLTDRLLLMPGGRAEILLENAGARPVPRRLTLGTAGLAASRELTAEPGEAPNGEVAGDVWPAMPLATVILPAQHSGPPVAWPPNTPPASLPVAAAPLPGRSMPGCSILPTDTAEHRWHRRITFAKTGADATERFLMGMRVMNQRGEDFFTLFPDAAGAIGRGWDVEAWLPHGAAAGQHPPPANLICPVLGRAEVWVIANASPELHNLHLHQGRFRLANPSDPGAPDALAEHGPMTDPTGVLEGLFNAQAARALSWHDALPVAPQSLIDAEGRRTDGTTTILLPFAAAEQEGLYPVHCHILEHEDKGMMAAVLVLPPAAATPAQGTRPSASSSDAALLAALATPGGMLPASCLAP